MKLESSPKAAAVLEWTIARLGEQSTWKGLIGFLTACGISIAPEIQTTILSLGLAAIAMINVLRKEAAPEK
ncbi:hypothetical protein [uncultured Thiodictyon sp.]|uniref:hypothetical protein n=1 Tax=uncultured Thiodictyon sp. TaxID=1846217 RepID=UPI0025CEB6E5|nr:hypothetical protein [uncultured Thiodictyon sp.]